MPDLDTTIIFFGTLIYVFTILIGFLVINELKETNKNLKRFVALLFHSALASISRESRDQGAQNIRAHAFQLFKRQFPKEIDDLLEASSKFPREPADKNGKDKFEGLNFKDLF